VFLHQQEGRAEDTADHEVHQSKGMLIMTEAAQEVLMNRDQAEMMMIDCC